MPSSDSRQNKPSHESAWNLAWERFKETRSRGRTTTVVGSSECEEIPVLDGSVKVDEKCELITSSLPEYHRLLGIVVLHYLTTDKELGWDGHWSLFRQMLGGESFHQAFHGRIVTPLAKSFSPRPQVLLEAGRRLKGTVIDFGDATVILPFLPRLPVRVTVWKGDDEVPGNAVILFPSNADRLLPTEDLVEVGDVVLRSLLRASLSSDR